MFNLINSGTHVQAKDDFYSFTNSKWYKNVKLDQSESYITEIDDFRLVQFKVYNNLEEIIKKYIKTNHNKESNTLKNFYTAAIVQTSSQKCFEYAKKELEIIDNYRNDKDKSNPWKLLGYMNKNEMYSMSCPFHWKVDQDEKNVDKNQCYITSPLFSLPDTSVYFDDGTNKNFKK